LLTASAAAFNVSSSIYKSETQQAINQTTFTFMVTSANVDQHS